MQTPLGIVYPDDPDLTAMAHSIDGAIRCFFGGTVDDHEVTDAETYDAIGYGDLATIGPTATVAVRDSGLLEISIRSRLQQAKSGFFAFASFELSGANVLAADDVRAVALQHNAPSGHQTARMIQTGSTFLLKGLTPGATTVTMKYRVTGSVGTFARRQVIAKAL